MVELYSEASGGIGRVGGHHFGTSSIGKLFLASSVSLVVELGIRGLRAPTPDSGNNGPKGMWVLVAGASS